MRTTLPEIYQPMMQGCSITTPHCAICGRPSPLNQHHIVKRSAGELIVEGRKMPKPTITLCGFGNNLKDADGHMYCHGMAHHQMLHFKWVDAKVKCGKFSHMEAKIGGHWEFLITKEPTRYIDALEMEGWQKLPRF